MSKLDSIKQQFPELNLSIIDILARFDKTKTLKYLPSFCKAVRDNRMKQRWNEYEKQDIKDAIQDKFHIELSDEELNDWKYIQSLYYIADNINRDIFEVGYGFMDYMERGLIDNKDVLKYTSMDDMRGAVSVAALKLQSKELEKQVVKVFEDDEWVVVRPLTFEASAKYGAGTKWCTTYQNEKTYFARYWKRGILAYFINKINGAKWGLFKNISEEHEPELSWWNAADKRADFLEIDFNEKMYGIVRTLLHSTTTNSELCDEKLREQVLDECEPQQLKWEVPPPSPQYINMDISIRPGDYPLPEPEVDETEDTVIDRLTEEFQRTIDEHLIQQLRATAVSHSVTIPNSEVPQLEQVQNEAHDGVIPPLTTLEHIMNTRNYRDSQG